jgi:rod shape-determining protein MreC
MHLLEHFASTREFEKRIEILKKKYDDVFAENIALKAINQYVEETKELRNFNKRYLLNCGHVAQILARHFSSNNQFFLLDAGSSHGIQKGMVALYGNVIVGKVVCVYPWYCKVCLTTDADCKIAALCLPSYAKKFSSVKTLENRLERAAKSASGIHEGINSITHAVVRYVSHLESVNVGDDVFSSGEGLVFPKGFALGKIISADKGDLFYTITVQPLVDFESLQYCMLIAKEDM